MPIREEMKARYPNDWKLRSLFIRKYRARDMCEWCGAKNGKPHPITGSKVVLTAAHIFDHRPEAKSLLNLAALCQRCHNRHDAKHRREGIQQRKREQSGMKDLFKAEGLAKSTAIISDDGLHRYLLERVWNESGGLMLFIMLNPSTADANRNDPTIRRCIEFAKRGGYGGIAVVNLFSLRTPKPSELVGVLNGVAWQRHFMQAVQSAVICVAAWGSHKIAKQSPAMKIIQRMNHLWCLGATKDGSPRHPLYVRGDVPLMRYSVRDLSA